MKYKLNGRELSTCMIGTWAWGSGQNGAKIVFGKDYEEKQLRETFDTALENGFNFWDTAEVYGAGSSEQLLGSLIGDKDVVISTKHFPDRKYRPGENRAALECSLQRLGKDHVDIYWLHAPRNIKENMTELASLQKEGLVGSIGLSNGDLTQIRMAEITLRANGSQLAAIQNHYSLLSMEREAKILDYCRKAGILFFGYMILEQGALSGHYDSDHSFPLLSVRGLAFPKSRFRKIRILIDYIRELGEKYGIDSSQIPIAWAAAKGVIPIVGLTKPEHAISLNAGLTTILTEDEIRRLEELAAVSGVKCKGFWE